jgi:hypothetical protein
MGEEQIQPAANAPAPTATVVGVEQIAARPLPPPLPTAVAPGVPPGAPAPPTPPAKKTNTPPEPKDSAREIVETVVFVVVLVLLLKTFLAEAFVIPTGSMADTLLGYHKTLTCEQCGYPFRVNLSRQVDPEPPHRPHPVTAARCPNCEYLNRLQSINPDQRGGFPKPGDDQ